DRNVTGVQTCALPILMGIAIVMLLSGGEDALSGLQSLTYLIALPFSIVLILMVWAFLKDLSTDPARIRYDYAQKAMSDAVIRGRSEERRVGKGEWGEV